MHETSFGEKSINWPNLSTAVTSITSTRFCLRRLNKCKEEVTCKEVKVDKYRYMDTTKIIPPHAWFEMFVIISTKQQQKCFHIEGTRVLLRNNAFCLDVFPDMNSRTSLHPSIPEVKCEFRSIPVFSSSQLHIFLCFIIYQRLS